MVVPGPRSYRIDQSIDYPCPCRRTGRLKPIALTEAFGCNLCQQIFVIQEDGYSLEPVSTYYPYRRAWQWTGSRWRPQPSNLRPRATLILLLLGGAGLGLFILITLSAHWAYSALWLVLGLLAIALIWLATYRF